MKCREKLMLAVLALMLAGQTSSWRLESMSQAAPLGHEAVFVIKTINGPTKVEMKLVFFDEKQCALRVAANASSLMAAPLNELGSEAKALAVCNGGYFNAGGDFGPSGLEVARGKRADKFRGSGGWVGALMVKRGLNLDGGPSTGLWCRSADGREQFEKPGWAVRNAIMVVPRDLK